MKYNYLKYNNTAGETTKLVEKQSKIARFKNSNAYQDNFLSLSQGPMERRSGSILKLGVKDSTKKTRGVQFLASDIDIFNLEFGHKYIRFIKDQGYIYTNPIYNGSFDTGVSGWVFVGESPNYGQWDPSSKSCYLVINPLSVGTTTIGAWQQIGLLGVGTYTVTFDLYNQDAYLTVSTSYDSPSIIFRSSSVTPAMGRSISFTNTNTVNSLIIGINTSGSAGTNARIDNVSITRLPYEINSPYDSNDIFDLNVSQNGNVLTITHGNYAPRNLTRNADYAWILEVLSYKDGPYLPLDLKPGSNNVKVTPSGTFGNVTVTATEEIFSSTDVGRHFRYRQGPKSTDFSQQYNGTGTQVSFDVPFFFDDISEIEVIKYANTGVPTTLSYPGNYSVSGQAVVLASAPGTDEKILIKIKDSKFGRWGWGKILAFISTTQVIVSVEESFEGTAASKEWEIGAWSTTTGFPICSVTHKGRLFFGGTPSQLANLEGSHINDKTNFSPDNYKNTGEVDPDGAISIKIASNRGEKITWLLSKGDLYIGTTLGINLLRSSNEGENITPQNASAIHGAIASSSLQQPLIADNSLLFLDKNGKKLYGLQFRADLNQFNTPDLLLLSEHLADSKLLGFSIQYYPEVIIWAWREDGVLLSLTYNSQEQVAAWARHSLGHNGLGAKVKCVSVIPSLRGEDDEVWLIVERIIDGKTKQFWELLAPRNRRKSILERTYLDCSLTFKGNNLSNLTELIDLNNELVNIVIDGHEYPAQRITSNQLTLPIPGDTITIGYNYQSIIKLHDFPIDLPVGTMDGLIRRITEVDIDFYEVIGGKFKLEPENNWFTMKTQNYLPNEIPVIEEKSKKINLSPYTDKSVRLMIMQDQPYPMTISSIMLRAVIENA